MTAPPLAGRFDDLLTGRAFAFGMPERTVVASSAAEIRAALDEVDAATRAGAWAYGFVGYEAAAGLDPSLSVCASRPSDPPLVWFAIGAPPTMVETVRPGGEYDVTEWTLEATEAEHAAAVERIRAHIAAGDTYQVNLTTRLRAQITGDPRGLYADLVLRQRPAYAALLETPTHVVASSSPELFFEWTGDTVLTRPMKGTAGRGRSLIEDADRRAALLGSEKERAENVIVVDLLRNDLSRVARTGSVAVPRLGHAERYETVWQLTSDVVGTVPAQTPLVDVFTALFPSGSVTGAPKPRTTQLIAAIENAPRGLYCGAIGWVAPLTHHARARFNVAIRTAVIERASGVVTYGVGSGVTWSSNPADELAELGAKARVLDSRVPAREFALFETMAYVPGTGVRHRAAHLRRLATSADYFGFRFDPAAAEAALDAVGPADVRVRLTLERDGRLHVDTGALPPPPDRPVTLAVDLEPVDTSGPWTLHKTTVRTPYDERLRRHASDDVVLVNERGHVMESAIANIAVGLDGRWWTPPAEDGCLPGIARAHLIATGALRERTITVDELAGAEGIALVSSLRGWRPAVLAAR